MFFIIFQSHHVLNLKAFVCPCSFLALFIQTCVENCLYTNWLDFKSENEKLFSSTMDGIRHFCQNHGHIFSSVIQTNKQKCHQGFMDRYSLFIK
jgi:hypothetical protein